MRDPRSIPDSSLVHEAMDFASSREHPEILAHSIRVFLLGNLVADNRGLRAGVDFDTELLFVASAFHDIGTADEFNSDERFEIAGADAASNFLASRGFTSADVDEVWRAIALHTSPGIAERCGSLSLLVRLGVLTDFHKSHEVSAEDIKAIEASLPRGDVEVVLGSAVVSQCVGNPAKAPKSSWPGSLYFAHIEQPGHVGINPAF